MVQRVAGMFLDNLALSTGLSTITSPKQTSLGILIYKISPEFEYAEHGVSAKLRERVQLPYQLLSDESLELVVAAKLPTIQWRGSTLTKRLTMAVEDGKIVKVWYPVFPPDKNASEVLEWLKVRK